MSDVRIGLLGLGTVGAGVVKILQTTARDTRRSAPAAGLTLAAIADTRPHARRARGSTSRACRWPPTPAQVLDDPADPHRRSSWSAASSPRARFILAALAAGKHVVTANKALLAHHGAELYEEARARRRERWASRPRWRAASR